MEQNNIIKFRKYVEQLSSSIGVLPNCIQIRDMNKKWASCSTSGRLTFSKDLLDEKKQFQKYVIIHELLHLQIPNHGKLFKALLLAYVPKYRDISKNRSVCGF